jgi:putative nucleotidyltransferase with HDIG domain
MASISIDLKLQNLHMSTFVARRSDLNRRRVIFVDDEAFALEVLQRVFEPMRTEWHMEFVTSAADALVRLEQMDFDAIVSDLKMPNMNGAELLEQVMHLHPTVSRIILSAQADEDLVYQSVNTAHQFISKTSDPKLLVKKLRKVVLMRQSTLSRDLVETICAIEKLPTVPQVYCELIEALADPNTGIGELAAIVERDGAIGAKLLQLANSAFFGARSEVSSIAQAMTFLGVETVRYLVLMVGVCDQFRSQHFSKSFVEEVWSHSVQTANLARIIAESEHTSLAMAEQSFVAGLLHDVGKLILAENLSRSYAEVLEFAKLNDQPIWQAERQILKATHGDIGAYLLDLWGLPDGVTKAVGLHHEPIARDGEHVTPLAIVHAANHFAHELENAPGSGDGQMNAAFLEKSGLIDRIPAWREAIEQTAQIAMA